MARLNYGISGQTLRHTPGTRQASIVWTLEDLRYAYGNADRTLATGTANVDAATEVTTAVAGPTQANPRRIEMDSTAGFAVSTERARTFYEIVNADTGAREAFEVDGIDTDDALITTTALVGVYPVGSTVRGLTHVTAAIGDDVLLDEDRVEGDLPMRVVWVYADGTRHQEQVRLVHDAEADLFVTSIVADCRGEFPDLDTRPAYLGRDTLPTSVRGTIRKLRAEMLGRGRHLERWLTGEQGHWLAVWRTLLHLAQSGNVPGNTTAEKWIEYCQAEADKLWHALSTGWGKSEVLELDAADNTTTSSNGTTYQPADPMDL